MYCMRIAFIQGARAARGAARVAARRAGSGALAALLDARRARRHPRRAAIRKTTHPPIATLLLKLGSSGVGEEILACSITPRFTLLHELVDGWDGPRD
jgi:hypothetical protein